ncbi:hypothetical protein C8Q79DRAFT_931357 [Trametes meyenii]|nr:hypothetical protein C8Q79DRAFT_931357 [Trametes meyenii]
MLDLEIGGLTEGATGLTSPVSIFLPASLTTGPTTDPLQAHSESVPLAVCESAERRGDKE